MRTSLLRRTLVYGGFALFLVWILFPLYFTALSSFMTPSEIGSVPFHWLPEDPTLANYVAIFTGDSAPFSSGQDGGIVSSTDAVARLMPAIGRSLLVGFAVVASNLIIGGAAGYAFSRYEFRGSTLAYLLLLASRVVPAIAIVLPFFIVFRQAGLLNTSLALVISYNAFTLPLAVWLLKTYFDSVPKELEEAAKIDGASRLRCLLIIVVPIARPGLIAAGLLVFLEAWSEFFYSLVLTNGLTVPPVVAGLQNLQQFSWTTLAAATMFTVVPPVLIALAFQRYIVTGLAAGSVK
ncbi:carbohydrate ABC transporter permease [Micromonospora echinofusca]|uniref:ABC transporter permease subunit n=1 Tax=Micromonospora echinofusca TaxID=47858 RepID=A0ABS3VLB9_MICEH|nr:carbohydrate ABC transporter permease [Micromonospora echinofusca]MBO4205266.1 ABC transporter permease subunit [Micromonospora echinofusca]